MFTIRKYFHVHRCIPVNVSTRLVNATFYNEYRRKHKHKNAHTNTSLFCYYFHYLIYQSLFYLAHNHALDLRVRISNVAIFFINFRMRALIRIGEFWMRFSGECVLLFNRNHIAHNHESNDDNDIDNNQAAVSFGPQLFCLCMSSLQFQFTFTRDHMLFSCLFISTLCYEVNWNQ